MINVKVIWKPHYPIDRMIELGKFRFERRRSEDEDRDGRSPTGLSSQTTVVECCVQCGVSHSASTVSMHRLRSCVW